MNSEINHIHAVKRNVMPAVVKHSNCTIHEFNFNYTDTDTVTDKSQFKLNYTAIGD